MSDEQDDEQKPILDEIQDRYKATRDRLLPTLLEPGNADMRFVDGDTCPPNERILRDKQNRVWIDLDEINQYENQVINDIRANRRSIKVSPVGYGANDATARFYAEKIREIEYRSKAQQIAYPTALANAVWRGYGYARLKTAWVEPTADQLRDPSALTPAVMHQDLWIEEVTDPNTILPEADFQRSDLAGINFLYVLRQFQKDEFTRKWPKAKAASFDMTAQSFGWITDKTIQVAEYWRRTTETVMTIALIEDASGQARVVPVEVLKAEGIPAGFEFKRQRELEDYKVCQYLTNGVEILEKTEWIGRDIPFVGCFGKMLWRDKGSGSERSVHSMTRLARNPAQLYSYYATCEAEIIRQVPKFPYFFFDGTLSPESLELLQRSYDEPVVGIAVKHTVEGAQGTLGFPQRQPYEPPIAALQAGKEGARRAVQAAMGMTFLPTQAQSRNEKSGKALQQIEQSSQKGAYHFVDAFNLMIERTGVMLEDLLDRVLVGARDVSVINEKDETRTVRINDAQAQPGEDVIPSIKGRHAIVVSVGPSDVTEREQADNFVDTLVGTPELLQIAGPEGAKQVVGMAVRLKNLGPIGDEIAEVYDPKDQQEQQIPPEAKQMLMEAKQMMQGLQQENAQLKQALESKQVEAQSRERIAQQNNQTKGAIAQMQTEQKDTDSQRQAAVDIRLQQMEDTIKRMELAMKAAQMEQTQRHDREMAERGHEQAMETGERTHAQNLETQERMQQPEAGE